MRPWRGAEGRARARTLLTIPATVGTVAVMTVAFAPPAPSATSASNLPAAAGLSAYEHSGTGSTLTEADGTYVQHVLDGRVVWFFSDSFLGVVNAGGGRGPSGMLHNQIVVQDSPTASSAANFHNVWLNGTGATDFSASGCTAEWPAATIQSTLNQIQVALRCADSNGNVVRLDLATVTFNSGVTNWAAGIDTAHFNAAARVPNASCPAGSTSAADIDFGQSVMQVYGGGTYIYGVQNCKVSGIPVGVPYLAKVPGNDISNTTSGDAWSYWAGKAASGNDIWSSSPASAKPMQSGGSYIPHAGSEYSAVYDPGRGVYRMITTDTGLSPNIIEYTATDPAGPWTYDGVIDNTQTDGVWGSRPVNDPNTSCTLDTYGAKEQPTFETNDTIVFTYNVNVTGAPSTCTSTAIFNAYADNLANYNPRFMYG